MSASRGALSPWEAHLGALIEVLHPRLRAYFGAIPKGHIGRGDGVFEVVGTPRRWLWPVLALLARDGVIFPVWRTDVPFSVENRGGDAVVTAQRTFHFFDGNRVMVDATAAADGALVDRLGRHGRVAARLGATVAGGRLELVSTRVTVLGIPVPRAVAPRVRLTEEFDDELDRQRVSLTLDSPLFGRLYEYRGTFRYAVVPENATGDNS